MVVQVHIRTEVHHIAQRSHCAAFGVVNSSCYEVTRPLFLALTGPPPGCRPAERSPRKLSLGARTRFANAPAACLVVLRAAMSNVRARRGTAFNGPRLRTSSLVTPTSHTCLTIPSACLLRASPRPYPLYRHASYRVPFWVYGNSLKPAELPAVRCRHSVAASFALPFLAMVPDPRQAPCPRLLGREVAPCPAVQSPRRVGHRNLIYTSRQTLSTPPIFVPHKPVSGGLATRPSPQRNSRAPTPCPLRRWQTAWVSVRTHPARLTPRRHVECPQVSV